jgi:site-specific DNA recombinase
MAYPSIYGYTYTYGAKGKKNWVVDEKEAETIKFIFREYVNEKAPINQIKLKLNDQGVKTKKGFAFSTSQIRAILKQPVYVGKIRNTKDELIKSEIYKPIVKDDIWELAQLELGRKQKSTNHFEQRPARYELSGVIKCGHCKASFHINEVTRPNRKGELHTIWKYYHSKQSTAAKTCKQNPRYLVRENVELQISNLVQSYFVDNDEMLGRWYRLHTTDLQREISQLELEVNSANLRLEAINKQKANLIDAITEGTLSKDDAKDKMIELNSVIRGLEIGIKEKGSTITLRKTESGSEYQMALVKLFRDFDVLTPVERRRLYQTIFKSVIIKDGKVTVTFFEGTKEKFLVDNHRKKK